MQTNTLTSQTFITIANHKLHYIDEGEGQPILIVHGIPEWSLMFNNIVQMLKPSYRCIVPDHLGFGLSDKDMTANLSIEGHTERLLQFIDALGLNSIHLVVHDLGGPIGLGALTARPALFSSVSIVNTFIWNLENTQAGKALKMMQGGLGRWLYLSLGFSVKFMARNGFADKRLFKKYYPQFMQHHTTQEERFANYQLMLEMSRQGAYFDALLAQLKQIELPMQLLWGMQDKFFTADDYLNRWKKEFPGVPVHQIAQSGHFPHLEAPKQLAEGLLEFYN